MSLLSFASNLGLSVGLVELALFVAFLGILVWPMWKICVKAGFPGPLGLLILVPIGNLVLLFYLAFSEWPALNQTAREKLPFVRITRD